MRLGNSNGNNRGKKYFLRKELGTIVPSEKNRRKADDFSQWIVDNRTDIINFLIMKNSYDEDAFAETYLRMYEKILYTGLEIDDRRAYFHRAYYTNYIQQRAHENRYGDPLKYDLRIADNGNQAERERRQMILENEIYNYVHDHYYVREFELFKMYITLKPAVNYKTLAEITGTKPYIIQRIISKIMSDLRAQKRFVDEYREVAA
ncbi:hypothetical protein [Dysgonomonas sp. 25]|uniref:hypothetical protein n=1 Tax=Dysgonomonas sp. 25 TaxID=2302933 RepID=UPI0013D0DF8A|nr:hypothetical protein [Dysgonomonas sp. 25]